jgi:hypothetical protein
MRPWRRGDALAAAEGRHRAEIAALKVELEQARRS